MASRWLNCRRIGPTMSHMDVEAEASLLLQALLRVQALPGETREEMLEDQSGGETWLAIRCCLSDASDDGFDLPADLLQRARDIFPDLGEYVDAVVAAGRAA